jgi:hypothetical protein
MGASDRERKRLMRQGAILREPPAAAFRAAGITSGILVAVSAMFPFLLPNWSAPVVLPLASIVMLQASHGQPGAWLKPVLRISNFAPGSSASSTILKVSTHSWAGSF